MTLYRQHREAHALRAPDVPDGDVLPVAFVLWVASVALVLLRIRSGAPLELDGSLATLVALALPLALLRIKKV